MPKIPTYPSSTAPNNNDLLIIEDSVSSSTKKITRANLLAGTALPTNTVTTASITDNSVTASKLATNAITLGYSQTTAGSTSTSNTGTLATGLSTTVTIPAGGRRIKITAWCYQLRNNTLGNQASIQIWDGTVGVGTKLSEAYMISAFADIGQSQVVIWTGTPAAGSKTYNVGLSNIAGSNTAKLDASATAPAFILVEAI